MTGPRFEFWHERLDVYRVSLEFVTFVEELGRGSLRAHPQRVDQLRRAADSIVLNIAEGSSQHSMKARHNHYRIALGSAGECHAILELSARRGATVADGQALLGRIAAMLSRM